MFVGFKGVFLQGGIGVDSVLYESTAPYWVTLKKSAPSSDSIIVVVNTIEANRNIYWSPVSSNSFRVNVTANGTTTPVANSFVFSVAFI